MRPFMLARRTVLAIGLAAGLAGPALAQSEEQAMVDKAKLSVEALGRESNLETMRHMLTRAKAVMVFPELIKGGFIIGGEGGGGLLLTRNAATGAWSAPAFYTLAAGSIGLQIGGQVSQMMMLIMTDKGLEAVYKNQFKAGADASIAAGPVGRGIEAAATSNLRDDIYAFSITKGLFGGASLEGAAINPRFSRNQAYHGQSSAQPRDIVTGAVPTSGGADGLRQALKALELH